MLLLYLFSSLAFCPKSVPNRLILRNILRLDPAAVMADEKGAVTLRFGR